MSFRTTGIAMLGAMALTASAAAQTPQTPPAITRTMVAATKLPAVTDVPLYFKAVSVTIPSGEKSSLSAANGILYQMSGSTEVSFGGEIKMLGAGEALFIPGGKTAMLKAGSGAPSAFLHFLLAAAVDLDSPAGTVPAVIKELYRTPAPIPDLKPGGYDLSESHSRRGCPQTRHTIAQGRPSITSYPARGRTRLAARSRPGGQVP